MDINELVEREAALINGLLKANSVRARVALADTAVISVGFIRYGLTVAANEKFARVESLRRELSVRIAKHRQTLGITKPVHVIPTETPLFGLEVPHPEPRPLMWSPRKLTTVAPHTMLIGRSYLGAPKEETVAFDSVPHCLICGITGAGKTALLRGMLLSLCANTSPDDLKLVLVDLKNEDLAPLENLPHVLTFAGQKAAAIDAIRYMVAEKDKRVEQRGYKPYRLVLVIDEMAQLSESGDARAMLGDLASIGRGKLINLIGATQHPTEKGGLGSLLKANFPIRLAGMVSPGLSYIATGRPNAHADLLPGRGSFLRCQGPDAYRFQSYFIDDGDAAKVARHISAEIWPSTTKPSTTAQNDHPTRVVEASRSPVVEAVVVEEIDQIAATIAPLIAAGASKNAMCKAVFGRPYAGSYAAKIDAAMARVDGQTKIIKLRKAG